MKQSIVLIVITVVGTILSPQFAVGQAKPDQVSGWVQIQPDEDFVRAEITYRYVNIKPANRQLTFYLDKHLKLTRFQCTKLEAYSLERDKNSPLADLMNTLSVRLQEPPGDGETITISLAYEGNWPLNQFGDIPLPENWIEVSFNSLNLVPVRADFTPAVYNLDIKTGPAYKVFFPGQATLIDMGSTRIQSAVATAGVHFIVGKGLQVDTFIREKTTITLISDKATDSLKREVVNLIAWCLTYYNRTFGRKTTKHRVTLALRPFQRLDASYAAGDDYFVTYDSREDFFRRQRFHVGNIFHEMGHFWWRHAEFTTTHNWLNEGFAEYLGIKALGVYFGRDEFQKQLQNIQARVAKLPDTLSLADYDARGPFGNAMSYSKGALLLYRLEERIGEAKFDELLAETARLEIKTSGAFIAVVERMLGTAEARRVEKDIKNE
jgi:hypothetical protein